MKTLILTLALVPSLLAAQSQPVPVTTAKPGWQWTLDSAMTVVNTVRAGRSLQPAAWPNGAKVAVALSFDVDNETIALRFGEPNAGSLSMGQYGSRQGLRRVVQLLDKNRIPATFFIPSVSLQIAPEMAGVIKKSGRHEFGVHGWIHEMNTSLPDSAERALLTKALADLTRLTGTKPTGYRAPSWNFSPNTLSILRDLGFRYESSLMADESPYELLQNGTPTGMVELPVEWIKDDAPYLGMNRASTIRPYTPPSAVLEIFQAEFNGAVNEGGLFLLTMHPHIIGHRSRIALLADLIRHMKSVDGVWFATHEEVARYCLAQGSAAG